MTTTNWPLSRDNLKLRRERRRYRKACARIIALKKQIEAAATAICESEGQRRYQTVTCGVLEATPESIPGLRRLNPWSYITISPPRPIVLNDQEVDSLHLPQRSERVGDRHLAVCAELANEIQTSLTAMRAIAERTRQQTGTNNARVARESAQSRTDRVQLVERVIGLGIGQ